jgi:hypothetical protein
MRRRRTLRSLAFAGLLMLPNPASAHHSFSSEFDESRTVHLEGKVTKVDWSNPHVLIYLGTTDGFGKPIVWTIQMSQPQVLVQKGWQKATLKPDMKIRVEGFLPRKDTHTLGSTAVTIVATGQVLKTPTEWVRMLRPLN